MTARNPDRAEVTARDTSRVIRSVSLCKAGAFGPVTVPDLEARGGEFDGGC
jgi:hypothetical protein